MNNYRMQSHATPASRMGFWQRVSVLRGTTRRATLAPAVCAAQRTSGFFPRCIAFVLRRSVLITVKRLPVSGFTWPLLPTNIVAPIMLLNRELVDAALAEAKAAQTGTSANQAADEPVCPTGAPLGPAQRRLAHVLLHEAAHHCGIVWPEWRNWVNSFARRVLFFVKWRDRRWPVYPYERIYGVGVNSADNIAERLLAGLRSTGSTPR